MKLIGAPASNIFALLPAVSAWNFPARGNIDDSYCDIKVSRKGEVVVESGEEDCVLPSKSASSSASRMALLTPSPAKGVMSEAASPMRVRPGLCSHLFC